MKSIYQSLDWKGPLFAGVMYAALTAGAAAASTAYRSAVLADNPFVYYRFNETSISAGTAAADSSGNNRPGTYVGNPTGGAAGSGAGSDGAVVFGGSGQYLDSTATGFGSALATSSYEFVFKINGALSIPQRLFGELGTNSTGVAVTLASDAGGNFATNSVSFFIRDDSLDGRAGAFTDGLSL